MEFETKEFRFLSTQDKADNHYSAWSRVYEYPAIIELISKEKLENPKIHNSSWGFEGDHVKFRDKLDLVGDCTHTDIVKSEFRETIIHDITKPEAKYNQLFDFVLNISTIEHLEPAAQKLAFNNLMSQVKIGGHLLVTFDYPRVDLKFVEKIAKAKCQDTKYRLNGLNSIKPDKRYNKLNIVILSMKRVK
jgi:hypothetical protein